MSKEKKPESVVDSTTPAPNENQQINTSNQNDKRYTDPFEDDGAYADDSDCE